jgi:glycosyltransferase involved in cell wall biosynthesis
VARHSGLAEIAEGLEQEYAAEHRELASFTTGDSAELAAKLEAILALPVAERRTLAEAARRATVERWSWTSVAHRLLAAVA